jgi:hypothetical protein
MTLRLIEDQVLINGQGFVRFLMKIWEGGRSACIVFHTVLEMSSFCCDSEALCVKLQCVSEQPPTLFT